MAQKKVKSNFLISQWQAILFLLVVFLRLPSLFEPFTYGDEGIYLTLGQAIRRGLILYRDIHDNKPPLLYLLAAIANNFAVYRVIFFVWSFITIYLFKRLSQLLFKNKYSQIFSTSLFAVLISIRTFEGNIGNAENFMLLPTIAGFYLYLKAKNFQNYFLTGLLFSFATLFKVPAAFDFIALLVFLFLNFLIQKKKNYLMLFASCSSLIAGFLLPVLSTFIYFHFQEAFKEYLNAAFFQNLPYLSSWIQDKPKIFSFPLPLLIRAFGVFVFCFLLLLLGKKISLETRLLLTLVSL